MGGAVIEEMLDAAPGGFGWVGLFSGEGAQGDVEGTVDCPCIIQQFTKDLLYPQGVGGLKVGRIWGEWSELVCFTVKDGEGGVWRVLCACGAWVRQFVEESVNVSWHG